MGFTYRWKLDEFNQISIGTQAGYYLKQISLDNYQTGSQYVSNYGYDPSVGLGENIRGGLADHLALSSGLQYGQDKDGDAFPEFQAGLAFYRLNRPVESFVNNKTPLPLRYVFTAGKEVFQNDRWIIAPETRWVHQDNQNFVSGGARIHYLFANDNPLDPLSSGSIGFQAQYRHWHAVAFGVQFNQPDFSVGFSYDVGASPESSPLQGATEFALVFRKRLTVSQKSEVIDDYSIGQVRQFYDRSLYPKPNTDRGTTLTINPEKSRINDSLSKNYDEPVKVRFELAKSFQFAFNKAQLTPEAKLYLDKFYQMMVKNPDLRLKVTGHTDDIGSQKANLELSLRRARSVTRYLEEKGIEPGRLEAEGKGESVPVVPNDSQEHRSKNRRVEFVIFSGWKK